MQDFRGLPKEFQIEGRDGFKYVLKQPRVTVVPKTMKGICG